jgi:hypothetical protein
VRAATSLLFTIVLAVTGLAACGGGDGNAGTTTTSITIPTTTTIAVDKPGKVSAADQKAAEASVLKPSDLPGWKASAWPTGDQPFFSKATGKCASIKDADRRDGLTAFAHSDSFLSPSGLGVAMQTHVYPSVDEAKAVLNRFTEPDAEACISSTVSAMATQGSGGGATPLKITRVPVTVPGALGFSGTADAGPGLKLSAGYALLQRGRALVLLTTTGVGDKPPDFDSLLRPVNDRLSGFA